MTKRWMILLVSLGVLAATVNGAVLLRGALQPALSAVLVGVGFAVALVAWAAYVVAPGKE